MHILINYLDKKSEFQSEKVNGGTHALESWVWANSIQAPLKSIFGNHALSLSFSKWRIFEVCVCVR